ncbi:hypothetical protein [uncultured Helicobacter sp.]|uniref:hypothetical protein n=1 Tax=uncultured Helicobacter sp. TaxID=175537 RepID=UPI00374F82AD
MTTYKEVSMRKSRELDCDVVFECRNIMPQSAGLFTKEPKDAIINLLSMLFDIDLYKANRIPQITITTLPNERFEVTINAQRQSVDSLESCLEIVFRAFVSERRED